MNQEQIEKLLSLSESDLQTYDKVKKIISKIENSYICKEDNIVNWFSRTMKVGEIISEYDYKNVQSFNKHCWKKLTTEELIKFYKENK